MLEKSLRPALSIYFEMFHVSACPCTIKIAHDLIDKSDREILEVNMAAPFHKA